MTSRYITGEKLRMVEPSPEAVLRELFSDEDKLLAALKPARARQKIARNNYAAAHGVVAPAQPGFVEEGIEQMSEDFNEVYDNRPASPTRDREVVVNVVARRCVYVNNYRIAGGKPYVSENLPSHTLETKLGDVLDAFAEADILAALAEKKAVRDYFAAYHARKAKAA
jgi:hypothetical protein